VKAKIYALKNTEKLVAWSGQKRRLRPFEIWNMRLMFGNSDISPISQKSRGEEMTDEMILKSVSRMAMDEIFLSFDHDDDWIEKRERAEEHRLADGKIRIFFAECWSTSRQHAGGRFVLIPERKTITLDVHRSDRIVDVKKKIHLQENIWWKRLEICDGSYAEFAYDKGFGEGEESVGMKDWETLEDYNVRDGQI